MIEEEKLIQKAKKGDSAAFGDLYDLYHQRIYRFIFLKVLHKEEAEDLTHQVFLSAWKNIKNYQIRDCLFVSWLYAIARNKVIDYYRTQKTYIEIEAVSVSSNNFLQEDLDKSIQLKKVRESILKLNPVEQDVLIMRFVDDLPVKEVARLLGKNEGAIRVVQHRAIKKLQKLLQEK